MIFSISRKLNITFVFNPPYTPRLNPTEKVWDIHKKDIKREKIESKTDLISKSHEIFNEKCTHSLLTTSWKEKIHATIS